MNTLILELKDGRRHTLMGLKNAFEICFEIRKQLDFEANNDPKELSEMLKHRKRAGKKSIIAFSLCLILLVIDIAVPIFLIGNKEIHEFNTWDWSIFGAMCAALLPSFIILFIFAIKARKCLLPIAKLLYTLNRTMIETTPLLPGRVMKIYADDSFNGRIVIYNAETVDSVYYSVEKMNSEYVLEHFYTSDFIKREEFSEDHFSGLIDITDRMLKTNGSPPPQ